MNIKFVLVVLVSCIALSNADCYLNQCAAGLNSACNNDMYNSIRAASASLVGDVVPDGALVTCPSEFYCGINPSYIAGSSNPLLVSPKVCLPLGKGGDVCVQGLVSCVFGLSCYRPSTPAPDLVQGVQATAPATCQALGYAAYGEKCQSTNQCSGDLQCDWEQNICLPDLPNNFEGDCQSNSDCAYGNYCNGTSWCVPKVAIGGNCTDNAVCVDNALCTPIEGQDPQCLEIFSRTANQTCSNSDTSFDFYGVRQGCTGSTYCSNNNCTTLPTPTPASTNCTSNADCVPGFETCYCDGLSNKGTCASLIPSSFDNCATNSKAFYQCAVTNKCSIDVDYTAPFSCIYTHCKSEACAMYSSCNNQYPSANCFTKGESLATLGFCGGGDLNANSANIFNPSILLVLLAFAFVLFFRNI
ncbi:hypothetical protein PPL_01039 [Heterostelium album PN500]|uniref:Uncharacterized protein n=1 Tax=Heterostelium pallidum (strain ATCC 26659 / Pp 5 / PN500) TaxID=670386 RepID=D3AXY1_HETP5|nr:hypothetical protein PPL_01039 [Heterostelium album PN500]EFA85808.1 hypothetical protein PPL_01039 [Heterostelium album PN500]|eukprot:XP_020437914.1 hypothetical protein PPL_01039 [Heterostelium album PN500]